MGWILREAEDLDWNDAAEPGTECPQPAAKRMLAVLCLACITGVFDQQALARACRGDRLLGSLFTAGAPPRLQLSQFRRQHQGLLALILARVLARVLRHRFAVDAAMLSAPLRRRLHESAVQRLDGADNPASSTQ